MTRLRLIPFLLILLGLAAGSLLAAPLPQGFYQAEACVSPDCSLSGTWSIVADGARVYLSTSTNTSSVTFQTTGGKALIVYRSVGVGTGGMTVCVGASCTAVVNSSSAADFSFPVGFSLTGGTDTVTITATSASPIYIDAWMILADPNGAFPTPVPTATILPSSTPASTTTPQPTPTPQPTATPFYGGGAVWAIDPASRYRSVNGQIVRDEYAVTGGDQTITVLLVFLTGIALIDLLVALWKR